MRYFSFFFAMLLLGGITTFATTWILVRKHCHARWNLTKLTGLQASSRGWPLPVPADWSTPNLTFFQESPTTSWTMAFHHQPPTLEGSAPPPMLWSHAITAGWPARALQLEQRSDFPQPDPAYPPPRWVACSFRGGFWHIRPETTRYDSPSLAIVGHAYPWWPIWPGFALNTALFAALWSLILAAPPILLRSARRIRRAAEHRCPACGYDRSGLPVGAPCPECGKRLT